ncbi:MAG TPA: hypothetical protein VNF29_06540 [Candidatus Binataceae bacterium]|nr:hypothetical protein [Candidatus Binataceae bacterium]
MFDDNEEFALDCYKIISRLCQEKKNADLKKMIASIGFGVDEIYTALQAADILAHLTRERLITGQMPALLERSVIPIPNLNLFCALMVVDFGTKQLSITTGATLSARAICH